MEPVRPLHRLALDRIGLQNVTHVNATENQHALLFFYHPGSLGLQLPLVDRASRSAIIGPAPCCASSGRNYRCTR